MMYSQHVTQADKVPPTPPTLSTVALKRSLTGSDGCAGGVCQGADLDFLHHGPEIPEPSIHH